MSKKKRRYGYAYFLHKCGFMTTEQFNTWVKNGTTN